jgi:hypothetical protein
MIGVLRALAQIALVASGPTEGRVREPMRVRLDVTAPPGATVRVTPPDFGSFELVSATRVERGAAAVSPTTGWATAEYRYTLRPTRAGTFTLPPFRAAGAQGSSQSNALRVVVRDVQAPDGREPAIVSAARIDPSVGVNFHALVRPDTVYVGQQATYQVGVFLDDDVRLRLRRNPEFLPPELRSMLAYDLPAGRAFIRGRQIGSRRYDVHVFQRAIFPLTPGRYDVPPAQLVYSLPITPGFFSREESHTARAEAAVVVALAPPAVDRPRDFTGAVGQLGMSARVDTAGARVGDPLVLVLRVEGTGNVKLLPRPNVSIDWADAVPSHERVSVDSASLLVRGAKEFEWILTPRRDGAQQVPALRYAYFDPYARRYEVATADPITVIVAPGALAAGDARGAPATVLPLRAAYGGPVAPALPLRLPFWLLLLAAPVPAALILIARRPRRAPVQPTAAARLRAFADDTAGEGARDARVLRRTFAAALGTRLALPSDALTRAGAFARALRRRGVSSEVADVAELLLAELDAAAYAGVSPRDAAVARRAYDVYCRVDAEARAQASLASRGRMVRSAAGALACILVAAAAGAAARRVPPATLFADGIAAYAARDFVTAQRAFADAAQAEPGAPDAWANAGTAAWAAGDTAAAVVGWHRAARLDPLGADDVRERLELVETRIVSAPGAGSAVPRVPVNPPALAAAVLWCAACAAAAAAARRPPGARGPLSHAATACALVAVAAGAITAHALDGRRARDLAVVASVGPVRDEPALAAAPGATVHTGEIARTLGVQNAWTRVRMDDGREGWMESERLRTLAAE